MSAQWQHWHQLAPQLIVAANALTQRCTSARRAWVSLAYLCTDNGHNGLQRAFVKASDHPAIAGHSRHASNAREVRYSKAVSQQRHSSDERQCDACDASDHSIDCTPLHIAYCCFGAFSLRVDSRLGLWSSGYALRSDDSSMKRWLFPTDIYIRINQTLTRNRVLIIRAEPVSETQPHSQHWSHSTRLESDPDCDLQVHLLSNHWMRLRYNERQCKAIGDSNGLSLGSQWQHCTHGPSVRS